VVRRVQDLLNRRKMALNGSRVLLLGLAYKRNTGDARESPALAVAQRLIAAGADVRAVDSHVDHEVDPRITRVDCDVDEIRSADIVVLLTDHDNLDLDAVAEHAPLVLDTRHRVAAGEQVEYL
jgi:UDP-N-acetyl-D-glucosamine dehydrogenase